MKPADIRIPPGTQVRLSDWDADDRAIIGKKKNDARERLDEYRARLETLQELLYAEGKHKILVVLQAMDTAGKDSTIRHVFQEVDPLGVKVASFKAPTHYELARDYLWRVHHHVPGTGEIAIFNRSHYEDVLITRVNGWIDAAECKRRYRQINDFEKMLVETGTTILKLYLHITKDEQKKRLEARRDTPEKQWKFLPSDLTVRAQWDDYMQAYEAAMSATSTAHAPWHVIPANSKLARNLMVSGLLIETLEKLKMRYPKPVEGHRRHRGDLKPYLTRVRWAVRGAGLDAGERLASAERLPGDGCGNPADNPRRSRPAARPSRHLPPVRPPNACRNRVPVAQSSARWPGRGDRSACRAQRRRRS